MSYTTDKCVICYLTTGEHKDAPHQTICAVCIEEAHIDIVGGCDGLKCSQNDTCNECFLCRKMRIFSFNVGVCQQCIKINRIADITYISMNEDGPPLEISKPPTRVNCDLAVDDICRPPSWLGAIYQGDFESGGLLINIHPPKENRLWTLTVGGRMRVGYHFYNVQAVKDKLWEILTTKPGLIAATNTNNDE